MWPTPETATQRSSLVLEGLVLIVTSPVLEVGTKPILVKQIDVLLPLVPGANVAVSVEVKPDWVFNTTSPVAPPVAEQRPLAGANTSHPVLHAVEVPQVFVEPLAKGQTMIFCAFLIAANRAYCKAPSNSFASMLGVLIEKAGMAKAVTMATMAIATISSTKVKPFRAARQPFDFNARLEAAGRIFVSKTTMEFTYLS